MRVWYLIMAAIFSPLAQVALGQTIATPKQPPRSAERQKAPPSAQELERRAKRDFALSLIVSLADEAVKYEDRVIGVRVQIKAADLLWEADPERSRAIFRRDWKMATEIEDAERQAIEEKKKKFFSGESKIGFIPLPPNLRGEILQAVALRDRKLAEELLASLENKTPEEEEQSNRSFDPTDPDLATERRLELALYLLEKGETERAVAVADPALTRPTMQGVIFLIALRKAASAAADARFSALVKRLLSDPMADAASLSLLSSYVFTPNVLAAVTANGTIVQKLDRPQENWNIPEGLRRDFLLAAAQILLRPPQAMTTAEISSAFFALRRLLPFFQQYLPDKLPAVQAQMNLLAQNASSSARERTEQFAEEGIKPESDANSIETDSVRAADLARSRAARAAAMKGELKARELAEQISDPSLKEQILAFVEVALISKLIEQRQPDKAMELLRKANIAPLHRIWFLTEIATLLGKERGLEARELLEMALAEARKASREEQWKAPALSAIANAYFGYDKLRAWQIAAEAVGTANAATFFKVEPEISILTKTDDEISIYKLKAPSLSLAALFAQLALDDLYQATGLARNIKDEQQRSLSLLAVAASQLKKG